MQNTDIQSLENFCVLAAAMLMGTRKSIFPYDITGNSPTSCHKTLSSVFQIALNFVHRHVT